jgi:hypothetical protein
METTFINDKENFPVILDGYLYQSWGKKKKSMVQSIITAQTIEQKINVLKFLREYKQNDYYTRLFLNKK